VDFPARKPGGGEHFGLLEKVHRCRKGALLMLTVTIDGGGQTAMILNGKRPSDGGSQFGLPAASEELSPGQSAIAVRQAG
jgi:hypothetical protein